MGKKAPRRNAFFMFMLDYKHREEARGARFGSGYGEVSKIAGEAWRDLPQEEKDEYKKRADEYNKSEERSQGYFNRYRKKKKNKDPPLPNRALTLKEAKQRREKLFIQNLIEKMTINELLDHVFYLIHVNVFCKTLDEEFVPAEIAISRFNLREGVTDVFHRILNPGVTPLGYSYEIKLHSEKTHRIPLDFVKATKGYLGIYKGITDFLRQGREDSGVMPKLYTMFDEPFHNCSMSAVKYSMKRIWETSSMNYDDDEDLDEDELYEKTFQVMSLPILFFHLKNKCVSTLDDNAVAFENTSEANIELLSDRYEFNEELACQFHKEIDNVRYCSQSYTVRWAQVIREQCLKNLDSEDEEEEIVNNEEDRVKEDCDSAVKEEKTDERSRKRNDLSEIHPMKSERDIKKEKDDIKIKKEKDDFKFKKEKDEKNYALKKEKDEARIKKEKEEKYRDVKKEKDEKKREIKKEKEEGYREIKKEKDDVRIKSEKDEYSRPIKLERDYESRSRRDRDHHRSYDDVRVKTERDDRHRYDDVRVKSERDDRHRHSDDSRGKKDRERHRHPEDRVKRERDDRYRSYEERYDLDFDTVLKSEHVDIPFEPESESYRSRDSRDSHRYAESSRDSRCSRERHHSDSRDSYRDSRSRRDAPRSEYSSVVKTERSETPVQIKIERPDSRDSRSRKETGTEFSAKIKTERSETPIEVKIERPSSRDSYFNSEAPTVKTERSETPIEIKIERPDSRDSRFGSEAPSVKSERSETSIQIKAERPESRDSRYEDMKMEDVDIPFDDQDFPPGDVTVKYPEAGSETGSVCDLQSTPPRETSRSEKFPMPIPIKTEFSSKTDRSRNEARTSKDSNFPMPKPIKVEKESDVPLPKSAKVGKDSDIPLPKIVRVGKDSDIPLPKIIKVEKDSDIPMPKTIKIEKDSDSDLPRPIKLEKKSQNEASITKQVTPEPHVDEPQSSQSHQGGQPSKNVFPMPIPIKIEKGETSNSTRNEFPMPIPKSETSKPIRNEFPMPMIIKVEKSPERSQPVVENPRKNDDIPLPNKIKVEDVRVKEEPSCDLSTSRKRTRDFIDLVSDSDEELELRPKVKKELESDSGSISGNPIKNEPPDSYSAHGMKNEEVTIEIDDVAEIIAVKDEIKRE